MDQEYITKIQAQEILRYIRIMSKRAGHDLGETGCLNWIEKHAKEFRYFAESIPLKCIGCGYCGDPIEGKECPTPLNRKRVRCLRIKEKGKRRK